MLLSSKQPVNRLAEVLAGQIPQSHVDGSHRRDSDAGAAEVHAAPVHLLPEPTNLQWVFTDNKFPQPAGNVVTEGRVDDRLDDFR